jgi:hypothetical protein
MAYASKNACVALCFTGSIYDDRSEAKSLIYIKLDPRVPPFRVRRQVSYLVAELRQDATSPHGAEPGGAESE